MGALTGGSGKIRYAMLATVLIITACGDDDSTGPGNQDPLLLGNP